MEMTKEQKLKRYYEILAEIGWIKEVAKLTSTYNFKGVESKFEYLHNRLNELIMNLKQLKIAICKKDAERIQNLKNTLWCKCSAEYQQKFMSEKQSYSYMY